MRVPYDPDVALENGYDVAAQLYGEGLGPEDIAGKPAVLPPISHDYPLIRTGTKK